MKVEIVTATLKKDKIKEFLELLKDLSKIKEDIRFKVEDGTLLIYSIDGLNGLVLGFKYYKKKASDYFDGDINDIDFVLLNLKKVVKQLALYSAYDTPLVWNFETEDGTEMHSTKRLVKSVEINNGKLRTFILGGESFLVHNLASKTIEAKVDGRYRDLGFAMSSSDFKQLTNLIGLNSESEIVEIIMDGKHIIFREKGWELNVGDTDLKKSMTFKKKYLNCIEPQGDELCIDIFETYMIFKGSDHDLMAALELER